LFTFVIRHQLSILNKNKRHIKDNQYYQRLWLEFLKGNMRSFREIYADFYPLLFNYGTLYLEKQDIENAIQDLFLYILQRQKSLKKVDNVKGYLITAYKHRVFKILKAQKLQPEELPTNIKLPVTENIWEDILRKIIYKLSPREQEIITLKYYQNYQNREIANSLSIEYQTVRNTLHNAIKKLRLILMDIDPATL